MCIKATVIVPIYNVQEYLSECLDSIINQTEKNIEIICINDGSTDSSLDIINKYRDIDHRIKIINQSNKGLASARNAGLDIAKGKFIFFVDSDDYIDKNTIKSVTESIERTNSECAIFGINILDNNNKELCAWIDRISPNNNCLINNYPEIIFDKHYIIPFVWRNCCLNKHLTKNQIRFNDHFRFGEDTIFQMQAFVSSKKIVVLKDKFYYYRNNRVGSLMNKYNKDLLNKTKIHILIIKYLNSTLNKYKLNSEFKEKFRIFSYNFIFGQYKKLTTEEKKGIITVFSDVMNSI